MIGIDTLTMTNLLLRVRESALLDPVTGIPNRLAAFQHLAALRCPYVTLGYIDLDHFKRINDEHGHEWLAVMPGTHGRAPHRWKDALESAPFEDCAGVKASVGFAGGAPETYAEILQRADAACYVAKGDGRNLVRNGDPDRDLEKYNIEPVRVRQQERSTVRTEFVVTHSQVGKQHIKATTPEAAVFGWHHAFGVVGLIGVTDPGEEGSCWLLHVDEEGVVADFTPWALPNASN
jgi:GGDEF domain-containing protein